MGRSGKHVPKQRDVERSAAGRATDDDSLAQSSRVLQLPHSMWRAAGVQALQRSIGNQAVQRVLVQRTLSPEPQGGEVGEAQLLGAYQTALTYIRQSATGKKIVDYVANAKDDVPVKIGEGLQNMHFYDPDNRSGHIAWNPVEAFAVRNRLDPAEKRAPMVSGIQSPALGLAHEVGHAYHSIELADWYAEKVKAYQAAEAVKTGSGGKFKGEIEGKNLTETEQAIAEELNEPKRARYDASGSVFGLVNSKDENEKKLGADASTKMAQVKAGTLPISDYVTQSAAIGGTALSAPRSAVAAAQDTTPAQPPAASVVKQLVAQADAAPPSTVKQIASGDGQSLADFLRGADPAGALLGPFHPDASKEIKRLVDESATPAGPVRRHVASPGEEPDSL